MRAFDLSPLFRQTVGFDRLINNLAQSGGLEPAPNYPPYNIERMPRTADRPERLRITLAVAGFSEAELDVTVEDNELIVRGKQQDEAERHFLHRGIAARQFQKTFVLAEGIEVIGAELKDGLLSIDLARPESARVAQRIAINGRG